jgi:hypothetical protein
MRYALTFQIVNSLLVSLTTQSVTATAWIISACTPSCRTRRKSSVGKPGLVSASPTIFFGCAAPIDAILVVVGATSLTVRCSYCRHGVQESERGGNLHRLQERINYTTARDRFEGNRQEVRLQEV